MLLVNLPTVEYRPGGELAARMLVALGAAHWFYNGKVRYVPARRWRSRKGATKRRGRR